MGKCCFCAGGGRCVSDLRVGREKKSKLFCIHYCVCLRVREQSGVERRGKVTSSLSEGQRKERRREMMISRC